MSAGDDEQEEYSDVDNITNITRNAVRDRAAMFGASKPTVMNKPNPNKSVLNRFPQFMANDANDTSKVIGGPNKSTTSPPNIAPKTAPKTYGGANKIPVSPTFGAQNSPQSLEKKTPPPIASKSSSAFTNNKMWTPPSVKVEDHNHNVKSVADTNRIQNNTSTFSGGKKVTSSSSFQDTSNSSNDIDNRKSCSDGTIKDIEPQKNRGIHEGNEILSNIKSQLKSTKTQNRTAEQGKVFESSRQRLPGNLTPGIGQTEVAVSPDDNKKTASQIEVRRKSTNKRFSSYASIKTRKSDNKKFKQISKGTLISSHDAPMKYRRPADCDITEIVEEYQTAVKDLVASVQEDEEIYDDVESFARGSCFSGDRVSFIADMTEEEEFGSDQTSGSGSVSASGSGGGFKQIEDIYEEEPLEEGEMEDLYEEFPEGPSGDTSSTSEMSEKERKEKEKQEKAEKLKQEKEEKKKKEAARKEQEKKEKAEKAEKLKLEKEKLIKEKKEKEKKEKEEKKKRLKSDATDESSHKGSIDDGEASHIEEEYDDCSVLQDGVMEEEYEAVDDLTSSASSLQTADNTNEDKTKHSKDDKEEKKQKEAARKEQERKDKEKQKAEKERLAKEKKEKERKEKEDKELKKKFKIDPTVEKVGSGVILETVKGGKLDLAVSKGDKVEIMRMDNNPTGKFLVKSEDNRWGYVESSNIEIPTDTIKEVMAYTDTYVNVEPPITEEGSHTDSKDVSSFPEEIYEECS